jgi:transcriptional regulator with XRE-family HTH domain
MTRESPDLAVRFQESRRALGLTQDDVATALGFSRSAISAIEHGKRKVSGIELRRFARLYRRPVTWLIGADDDPPLDRVIISAVAGLSKRDRYAVTAFARFLAHQSSIEPPIKGDA